MTCSRRTGGGFTLLELMIAVGLGLFIIGSILTFFVVNKTHYRSQKDASRLQEGQRFVAQFLAQDITSAGYRGCAGVKSGPLTNTLNSSTALEYDFSEAVEGFDNITTTLPSRLSALGITPIVGTDVLVVRGPKGGSVGVGLKNTGAGGDAVIHAEKVSQQTGGCAGGADGFSGLCGGDILLIADCQKARMFQAGSVTVNTGDDTLIDITHPGSGITPGNNLATWGGTSAAPDEQFDTDSEIVHYGTYVYYIDTGDSGEPALFRKDTAETPEELVEGVEDMQILYGENTNSDDDGIPDTFVDAANVSDWDAVVNVRVELLLRGSEENVSEGFGEYTFNGATVTAGDKRLRKTVALSASLRNRIP